MSQISSPLLVLHSFRYADDKLIAECLSPTEGRVTLLVRITHSPRAAVSHRLFRPMAFLEVEWEQQPRAKMQRPRRARVAEQLLDLQMQPHKSAICLFLAEFLLHLLRSDETSAALFHYVRSAMQWLDTAERDYANFHLIFLLRLTRFLGILPNVEAADLPHFDLLAGEFVALPPTHAHYCSGAEARLCPLLLRLDFGTMRLLRLSRKERQRILDLTLQYYRLHLPAMPELRSWAVLRELFEG